MTGTVSHRSRRESRDRRPDRIRSRPGSVSRISTMRPAIIAIRRCPTAPRRTRPPATARWAGRSAARSRRRRTSVRICVSAAAGSRADHVDAVAEQADRGRRQPLAQERRGCLARRSAVRISRIAPAHQLLDFVRACRRPAAGRDGSGPGGCSARPRRDRPWRRRSSPSPAAAGRGSARSRGARRDRRRWSARRGRAPCGVWISAQARPSFCFMPPERLPASRRRKGVRLLKASSRSIFSRRPSPRHAVDVGVEIDVLHHRQVGVEAEPLAHVADVLLDPLGLADDVEAGDPGVAAAGRP